MSNDRPESPVAVVLEDFLDALQDMGDSTFAFVNRRSGELALLMELDGVMVAGDPEGDELAAAARAAEIEASEDWLSLPDAFEIDEYGMMERFSAGLEDAQAREVLLTAIQGSGAFRRFKDAVQRRGLADAWYAYRDRSRETFAIEWLEAEGLACTRRKRPTAGSGA